MRPVELTMRAFGSFARETTLRFSDLQTGLYLIVGETGAGKTTIFDAIVFALFGAASGSSRKPDMLHSDYVEKSEDTRVRLAFEQGGRPYEVTRTIHFRKKRGTENEYGDGTMDAVLILPEETPVKGHAAVTRRCEELLGLNADQFRRIVMLAQGEFREFLSADAARKSDILGRLFDSSEYIRYQTLLGMARSALAERRKRYADTADTVLRTLFIPPEEDRALYLPGSPRLLRNLDALIEEETRRAGELDGRKAAARKAVDAVNTRMGAAEGDNRKLGELDAARARARQLDGRRDDMARLGRQYALAERAWRRVCPAREKWRAAEDTARKTRRDLEALGGRIRNLTEARDRAQAARNADEALRDRAAALHAEERKTADSLPLYDALAEKLSGLKREERAAGELRERLAAAEARRQAAARQLAQTREELAALAGADAEEVRAEAGYEQAKARSAELNGRGGVAPGVRQLVRAEAALRGEEEQLAALARSAAAAEERYHRAYRAFLSGQSGLLAAAMEDELRRTGSAVCPVCRSAFRAGQAHAFAPYAEGTPSQAEVDEAKRRFEQAEKKRGEVHSGVETRRAALGSQKDSLLERARKLLPDCGDWEQLAAGLKDASARFAREEAEAKALREAAARKRSRQAELRESSEALSTELDALTAEAERGRAALADAEKAAAALEAEAGALRDVLPFRTRGEAEEKRRALAAERERLNAELDAHQRALDAAARALAQAAGEQAAKEAALPGQEDAERAAESAFSQALAANGFDSAGALEAALAPMEGSDRESWLTRQQEALNAYRNDCANTERRVYELTEQTRTLRYTDLEELKRQLAAAGEAREAAEKACSAHRALLENHTETRRRVSEALNALRETDAAWERLDRLAELALGATAEGGRLSFERYVMGSIFREVLDMANRRLDIMSGGRYLLVHTTNAARSNAAAGLEIEVLDAATGKQRPADSLSGGESFQVSLSLALGLSDAAQSRAGGIGLDTIFIDEGFGALDSAALDSAVTVLNQLTEGRRLVGIISHVDKLEESIPQKLRVRKTARGSELTSELS